MKFLLLDSYNRLLKVVVELLNANFAYFESKTFTINEMN